MTIQGHDQDFYYPKYFSEDKEAVFPMMYLKITKINVFNNILGLIQFSLQTSSWSMAKNKQLFTTDSNGTES